MLSASMALLHLLFGAPGLKAKEPDLGTPKSALMSYVEAVKAGDYATAKQCWVIDGKDQDGALEVVVGHWTSSRRARLAAVQKFGKAGMAALGEFARSDLSDEALDRTLSRIKDSEASIKDDRATLQIRWKKDDGSPNEAFLFSNDPLQFRKVGEKWRLDATVDAGGSAEAILKPGTWGPLIRDYARMINEVADGLESKGPRMMSGLIDERAGPRPSDTKTHCQ